MVDRKGALQQAVRNYSIPKPCWQLSAYAYYNVSVNGQLGLAQHKALVTAKAIPSNDTMPERVGRRE